MKRLFCWFMATVFSLISAPAAVHAQQVSAPVIFSQEELDQLLAPVALYPDALLTQVLIAATYPLETVQAARFASQYPNLKGEELAEALEQQPWDPSVKALVEFPVVLAMMDDQLAWTQKLGDAFLAQPDAVMDTVQLLRDKAWSTGALQSNREQTVVLQDQVIVIEPATPEVIYVPYYNPTVVYGGWWWPARPPMVWVPPPRYRPRSHGDVVAAGIAFGIGVGIINSIFHETRPNWRDRNFVIHDRRRPNSAGAVWSHDPAHRLGAAYRDVNTRNRFRHLDPGRNDNRGNYRGHVPSRPSPEPRQPLPHTRPWMDQPNSGVRSSPARRPEFRPAPQPGAPVVSGPRPETRPAPQPGSHRRPAPGADNRPAPRSGFAPAREQAHPFYPAGSAGAVQAQAERGRASRETSRFNQAVTVPESKRSVDPNPTKRVAPDELQKRARPR